MPLQRPTCIRCQQPATVLQPIILSACAACAPKLAATLSTKAAPQ